MQILAALLLFLSAAETGALPSSVQAQTTHLCEQEGGIVVVGAGFSGLMAAYALQKHGCNVTILEAQNRIGGRAYSLGKQHGPLANLDVGAHWVVAGVHNPVTSTIAKELGVELKEVGGDSDYQFDRDQVLLFDNDGTPLSREDLDFSFDIMATRLKALGQYATIRNLRKKQDISVGQVLHKMDKEMNYSKRAQRLLAWHDQILFNDDEGAVSSQLSLDQWTNCPENDETWYQGISPGYEGKDGDAVVVGGFGVLEAALARNLTIRFGAAVREITSTQNAGVTLRVENTSAPIGNTSTTSDIRAAAVIVTSSLGVLKAPASDGGVQFDPPLSEAKQKAIRDTGFGSVTKLLVAFDKPFWPEQYYGFGVLDDGWHFIVNHQNEGLPHKNVLGFYLGGPIGRAVEDMPLSNATSHALGLLRTVFKNASVPDVPVAAYKSSWRTDPWARGAWSYQPLGSTCDQAVDLSEPEGYDKVLFAGEATCKLMIGCTHSAMVSGLREAFRILGPDRANTSWPMWKTRSLCEVPEPGMDDDDAGDDAKH